MSGYRRLVPAVGVNVHQERKPCTLPPKTGALHPPSKVGALHPPSKKVGALRPPSKRRKPFTHPPKETPHIPHLKPHPTPTPKTLQAPNPYLNTLDPTTETGRVRTPKPQTMNHNLQTLNRCRASTARIGQSRPNSGLGFHVTVFKTFIRVAPSLGSTYPPLPTPPPSPQPSTLNPKPQTFTQHPTPCTLHRTPYTLHPTPYPKP